MACDLPATLRRLAQALKPGGQLAVFDFEIQFGEDARLENLQPENTPLAQALRESGMDWQTWDFSEQTYGMMQRKRILAEEFKARFEAEGHSFLYEHLAMESESSAEPYDPDRVRMRRYLYLSQIGPAPTPSLEGRV